MKTILKNGKIFDGKKFIGVDIEISDGVIMSVTEPTSVTEVVSAREAASVLQEHAYNSAPGPGSKEQDNKNSNEKNRTIIDCSGKVILPGSADVHVHFREPGFTHKETIKTGSLAAARGGYTTVCTMPNLKPAPVDGESLKVQLDIIQKDAVISVLPYGAITSNQSGRGTLSDMDEMKDDVVAFSDDGKGIQEEQLMREAMLKAKSLGKMITAHCEDESLLEGGYIHKGDYAKAHGHKGICSESEWKQVERDIKLSEETGCPYHICHISTKETVELVRNAKARGADVTCETGPHYLVFDDSDLEEDGRFKMNPPIRSSEDKAALIEGIKDGTIDMIATDHAPHAADEKSRGLAGSAFGIVGLETAFPVLYSKLVKKGIITFEKLIELMAENPRKRFGLAGGAVRKGEPADLAIWDLEKEYTIDPDQFLSMGRSTPFSGMKVFGVCEMTLKDGQVVYDRNSR